MKVGVPNTKIGVANMKVGVPNTKIGVANMKVGVPKTETSLLNAGKPRSKFSSQVDKMKK